MNAPIAEILSPTMLAGRVALVTGGARGIGPVIAKALLALGADVVVCGRTLPDQLPHDAGRSAVFHNCDVRQPEQVAAMISAIGERFGRFDILVNNAGGSPMADAATASPRFTDAIIALNLTAPLHVATAAYALLARSPGGGSVINIASISGTRPSPGTAAYGAAKAGLISLSRSLAMEWGPAVRVNTIIVGLVGMASGDEHYGNEHYGGARARARIADMLPLRRMAVGEDVASAVAYLVSPLASYVSGAELMLHGGGERPAFLDLASS